MTWLTEYAGLDETQVIEVVAHTENEDYGTDAWTASCVLRVPWEHRHTIINDILSYQVVWPYRPDYNLTARTGSIVPTGDVRTFAGADPNLNYYVTADLTINFFRGAEGSGTSGGPGGGEGDIIFYETVEPQAQYVHLPARYDKAASEPPEVKSWKFLWGDTALYQPLTDAEAPNRLEIGCDYNIRYIGLSSIPEAAFTIVGKTNAAAVISTSLGRTFPIETLLAQSPVISRAFTNGEGAQNLWDLEIRLSYNPNTWNKYWRIQTQSYASIQILVEGSAIEDYKNHPPVDFTGVLP